MLFNTLNNVYQPPRNGCTFQNFLLSFSKTINCNQTKNSDLIIGTSATIIPGRKNSNLDFIFEWASLKPVKDTL